MAVSLAGQVALVTGAGRGLGREYALDLARRGAKVVVNDIGAGVDGSGHDGGPADQVVAEIKAAGGEAVANYNSVADYEGGYSMVKQAMDTWGRLDIAVCNAGILRDITMHNMSEEQWDLVMDIHLKGCYTVLRAAWPVFRQQAYGRVVLASSSSGLYGNFGQANYGAAKAGMVGLMNVLKLEGAKYNVNVHCIAPGASTRMTEGLGGDPDRRSAMTPDHVAPVVTYLCSPDCTDSGLILEARAGRYNRAQMMQNEGITYPVTEKKDVDWVAANWAKITDLSKLTAFWNIQQTREEYNASKAK
jgi:NAD(P)-dependent dehydrogenase (short-subunit alcohol dehydrogenase family)